jgi:hypothetical protein
MNSDKIMNSLAGLMTSAGLCLYGLFEIQPPAFWLVIPTLIAIFLFLINIILEMKK